MGDAAFRQELEESASASPATAAAWAAASTRLESGGSGASAAQAGSLAAKSSGETSAASLAEAVRLLRPTALVGAAAAPGLFTRRVLETLAEGAAAAGVRPVVMALSNPVSLAECTAEQALGYTGGRALFASGSPFPPVAAVAGSRSLTRTGLANNALIYPGLVLGAAAVGATKLTPDLFVAAAKALAREVSQAELDEGSIYPSLGRAREGAAAVAAAVAAEAVRARLAGGLREGEEPPGVREMAARMWRPEDDEA